MIKALIAVMALAVMALSLGYVLHLREISHIQEQQTKDLADQKTTLTASCDAAKAVSERVANDRQKQIDDLSARIAADSLRPSSCVPIDLPASCAASVSKSGTAAGSIHPHGLTSRALHDYAKEARIAQINFEACERFVDGIYSLKANTP